MKEVPLPEKPALQSDPRAKLPLVLVLSDLVLRATQLKSFYRYLKAIPEYRKNPLAKKEEHTKAFDHSFKALWAKAHRDKAAKKIIISLEREFAKNGIYGLVRKAAEPK